MKATHAVCKINDAIERLDGMLVMLSPSRNTPTADTGTAMARW